MPDNVGNINVVAVNNADVIRIEEDDSKPPAAGGQQDGKTAARLLRQHNQDFDCFLFSQKLKFFVFA
jgi:hypothetical protein